MWNWLWEQLQREWAVIRQTPLHFVVICFLIFCLSLFLIDRAYRLRIEGKDDLLGIYREKLGLAPYDKTKYASLRNVEVKRQAIESAHRLRTFAENVSSASSVMGDRHMNEMRVAKNEEEKNAIFLKYSHEMAASSESTNREYTENFKLDLILLRDEILSRLPRDVAANHRRDQEMHWYEWPVNPLVMNDVADHLEKLAKLLAD